MVIKMCDTMPVLKIENLTKSYGKTLALSGFSCELRPGIYALLGPNGSGKSTLINLITDNLTPDGGDILYNGVLTKKLGVRFREKIGFMPQFTELYPSFTAGDFLWYMAALKGIPSSKAKKDIPRVLEAVELADSRKTKIRALSGGMRQRLSLAQAVLGDPEILILDEPTAGLDPGQRIAVRNFIATIAPGKIILIATHVVSDVEPVASGVLFLKKGVLAASGRPGELAERSRGRVWRVICKENELSRWQTDFQVTGISPCAQGMALRVLSEHPPLKDAALLEPTLEDEYFRVFRGVADIAVSV